jgi:hypothetical protein
MRATINPGTNLRSWFEEPVAPLKIRYLKDTAIFLAHPSDVKEWIAAQADNPMPGREGELMQTLLESVITVETDHDSCNESDFQLGGNPGELDQVLDSVAYEERVLWRRASPFLEGEDSSGAFCRLL